MLGFKKRDAFQSYYSRESAFDDLEPGADLDWADYLNGPAQRSANRKRASAPDPETIRRRRRKRNMRRALIALVLLAVAAGLVLLARYIISLYIY